MRNALAALCCTLLLAACQTPPTGRYVASAENSQAIRALRLDGIALRDFQGPAEFDAQCRARTALETADGLSHVQYIQRAFEEELRSAGAWAAASPRVTIGAKVTTLAFASSSSRGIDKGHWDIDLMLDSSNGRTLPVSQHYEFDSGFSANEACQATAQAFSRAVQALVGRAVHDPGFNDLAR